MEKLDLTKTYKNYYSAKTKPEITIIERAHFLSIRGKGDPSSKEFAERLQALYSTAYTLKFIFKSLGKDFAVPKLEGLWWYDEQRFGRPSIDDSPKVIPRSEWEYRLLIRMPDFVKVTEVETSIRTVIAKKGIQLADEIELFEMTEGKTVQMLHVGPFATEPESLKVMQSFMAEKDLDRNGFHHEIYLSDFRKTPENKLKTILREPVK